MDGLGAVLLLAVMFVLILLGANHCGYLRGDHEGKWRERCRHLRCADGLPEWGQVGGVDACVCRTTAKAFK